MIALYADHNVALDLTELLTEAGYVTTTARDLGLERADDDHHFLVAVERHAILLTHNQRDVILLHKAWRRWSVAGFDRLTRPHLGIITLAQGLPAEILFQALIDFLATDPPLPGELYRGVGILPVTRLCSIS